MQYCVYGNLAEPDSHVLAVLREWWDLTDSTAWASFVTQRDASPLPPTGSEHQAFLSTLDSSQPKLPVLWDHETQSVVATSTHEIVAFWRENFTSLPGPLPNDSTWTTSVRDELLQAIRNAGFAYHQSEYSEAFARVGELLETLDNHLDTTRFLCSNESPSEADAWLFSVLVRFDLVYYGLYKSNPKRVVHYPNLSPYLRDLYQWSTTSSTVEFEQIRNHHYWEDERINPKRLVPLGGTPELNLFHNRARRFGVNNLRSLGTEDKSISRRQKGEWVRGQSKLRSWITADGSSDFPAEPNRYHLYIANNCPWCHRVALARKLKGLDNLVSMDVLYYRRDPEFGWQFNPEIEGCTPDTVNGVRYIRELYERIGSKEKSVPVLWDKKTQTIVNNESADIIRMFNSAFDAFTDVTLDLAPESLLGEIDEWNAFVYQHINNGAYKAGFASTQEAYNTSYKTFFAAMERLDSALYRRKFLCGETLTEADLRLFPTLFRFDHVYYTRFRLNHKMLREYPSLFRWFQEMLTIPGILEASNLEHCKQGYFGRTGNNIVPIGPTFSLEQNTPTY